MVAKADVLGIGQAMVDMSCVVLSDEVTKRGVARGSRNLVTVSERAEILEGLEYRLSAGGSLSNTLIDLSRLVEAANDQHSLVGRGVEFAGLVGNDALGTFYRAQMGAAGVRVLQSGEGRFERAVAGSLDNDATDDGQINTGTVVVLTDETADRTLFSYLGTQKEIAVCETMKKSIQCASILVLEGYVFELPEARRTVLAAIAEAKRHGVRVAMTAGDAGVVIRHGDAMWEAIQGGVDILFTNAAEATELAKCRPILEVRHVSRTDISPASSQAEAAALCLGPHCPGLVCVTDGSRGSVVVGVGEMRRIPPVWKPRAPIDTTGAGDAWCAGFLFGLLYQGGDLTQLGRLAARAASAVISHTGPTLTKNDAASIVSETWVKRPAKANVVNNMFPTHQT